MTRPVAVICLKCGKAMEHVNTVVTRGVFNKKEYSFVNEIYKCLFCGYEVRIKYII